MFITVQELLKPVIHRLCTWRIVCLWKATEFDNFTLFWDLII